MCGTMYELQRKSCGLLMGNLVTKEELEPMIGSNNLFITNNPRMIKALELCGYEKIKKAKVFGIETFAYCGF